MTTNNLFRDLLDGRIPLARKRLRPGIYILPSLADPTAPTIAELNAGVDISKAVTIDGYSSDPWPHMAPSKGWDEPKYVMPAPPYPTGNIATQKRRRKL